MFETQVEVIASYHGETAVPANCEKSKALCYELMPHWFSTFQCVLSISPANGVISKECSCPVSC